MDQIIMDFKSTGDRKTIFLTFTQIQFCTQVAISLPWHLPVAHFGRQIEKKFMTNLKQFFTVN